MGHFEHLKGWRAPWNEAEFISALTGGGDSRLRVDPASGTNKYFVPPIPRDGGVWLSSCTASPISQAGYRQAMRCYFDLATARSPDDAAARRTSWQAKVTGQLTGALQLGELADILLLPSYTDGLLLCSPSFKPAPAISSRSPASGRWRRALEWRTPTPRAA